MSSSRSERFGRPEGLGSGKTSVVTGDTGCSDRAAQIIDELLNAGRKEREGRLRDVAQKLYILNNPDMKQKDGMLSDWTDDEIHTLKEGLCRFFLDGDDYVLARVRYLGSRFTQNGENERYTRMAESFMLESLLENLDLLRAKPNATYASIKAFSGKQAAREMLMFERGLKKHQLDKYNSIQKLVELVSKEEGICTDDVTVDDIYEKMMQLPLENRMSRETIKIHLLLFKGSDPIEAVDCEMDKLSEQEPLLADLAECEIKRQMFRDLFLNEMDLPVAYTFLKMTHIKDGNLKKMCRDTMLESICENDEMQRMKMRSIKLRKDNSGKIRHKLTVSLIEELYQQGLGEVRAFMDENDFDYYDFAGHIDGLVDELLTCMNMKQSR